MNLLHVTEWCHTCSSKCLTFSTDSSVGLLASSLFQLQAHQKVDTIEVLVAICQACQSWKPLFDSWTTHSHWEHFDFFARLPGSPGLSPAPWRHEWPTLSGTNRGVECTDSPRREQMEPEFSDSRGRGSRRQHSEGGGAGVWERRRQVVQCWSVCVSGMSVWVSLVWPLFWLTGRDGLINNHQTHTLLTHLVPNAVVVQWTGVAVKKKKRCWNSSRVSSLRCSNQI